MLNKIRHIIRFPRFEITGGKRRAAAPVETVFHHIAVFRELVAVLQMSPEPCRNGSRFLQTE